MNRLRKIMSLLAAIGAVLVTALFIYKPVRDMWRERNRQEISLAQELTSPENLPEDAVRDTVRGESDNRQQNTTVRGAGREIPEVALIVKAVGQTYETELSQVTLWQMHDGTCYFFLPGFASNAEISLSKAEPAKGLLTDKAGRLQIGKQSIRQGDILYDIQWEQAYDMTIYDREENVVLEAPVIFICSSELPVLSLTTQSGSMDRINEVKGNEEAGTVALLDSSGKLLFEGKIESLSGRGNSTWGLAKKPYQLKLSQEASLFDFGKAKEYNLLANGYDETGLRNQLSLELAEQLGMSYVPQGQMLDVYMNGNYYGNYYLCEKVQIDKERVDIFDMEETTREVYRPQELKNLETGENNEKTRRWVQLEYEEEDISGGYLLERELKSRYQEAVSGFVTTQGDHYALESPVYASEAQVNYIADRMQEFQDAIEQKNGIHPVTGKHYEEYIDVASFVQKYLVEEVTKNYDGGVTSSFFYKPNDSVSTKIFAGPVWDYDVAFGNCNLDEIASNPMGITRLNNHIYGTDAFACLYEKDEFYQQLVTMYEQKALPFLDYLLEERIDTLVSASRESIRMDGLRWENLENRYQYYNDYDNSVRYLKYFIQNRRDFLNEVWLEGAVYHNVSFLVDGEGWQILCIKDGETPEVEPIPAKNGAVFIGWVTQDGAVPFDPYKPIYEDMSFRAIFDDLQN